MTGDSVQPMGAAGDGGEGADNRPGMSVEAYLDRIGLTPERVESTDPETLARLQRAHVLAVPFENLGIVSDPAGSWNPSGIDLSLDAIYEKVVGRGRGGYCFELNGLFNWLLRELGFDADRVAARVTNDGTARPPANHHTNAVELDQRYIVDVGLGTPMMRQPTPLDGTPRTDEVGISWRVAESDRPDVTYCTQHRSAETAEWSTRYVFSDVPRDLGYFEATNDFLQSAPESPFTGAPVAATATEDGHLKLSGETLTESTATGEKERTVSDDAWLETLHREFGLAPDE